MCDYAIKGFSKKYCTLEEIGLKGVQGVSEDILCPSFQSVIPFSICKDGSTIQIFSFLVQVYLDNTIHKKGGKFTGLDIMLTYYQAAFRTPGVPEKARVIYLTNLGMITGTPPKVLPEITKCIPVAEEILKRLRKDDPKLSVTIESLSKLSD